ncbi:Retrovirus-related Pol polyprotein from type-1 retrotransposable element R2, partial [Stegodyphus mimosarum]
MLFDMRTARLPKTSWTRIDDHSRPLLKTTINVPPEASNEYLSGDTKSACLGIPLVAEDSDIARVDGAFKLLTSRDPAVQTLAWNDLRDLITARIKRPPSSQDISAYLSASDDDDFRNSSNPVSSIWSTARNASRRLKVSWDVTDNLSISISHSGTTFSPGKRHLVFQTFRSNLRKERAEKLLTYPSQGKAIECAASASMSSCHFFRDGLFTRFADWRFIHRARFNLVPLNAVRRRNNGQRGCRRCNFPEETLPHVACHCMRYSRQYEQRHNTIVERIKKAASGKWNIAAENQQVTDLNLRPDMLLTRERSAIFVDVTVAFDNRMPAFERARRIKEDKYAPLAGELRTEFDDVRIEAVVVGALGGWDPKNGLIRHICSKSYGELMKLIVSDTIRSTRDIYIEHLSGVPQNTHDPHETDLQVTRAN